MLHSFIKPQAILLIGGSALLGLMIGTGIWSEQQEDSPIVDYVSEQRLPTPKASEEKVVEPEPETMEDLMVLAKNISPVYAPLEKKSPPVDFKGRKAKTTSSTASLAISRNAPQDYQPSLAIALAKPIPQDPERALEHRREIFRMRTRPSFK